MSERDLVTSEGVDEASADGTVEGAASGSDGVLGAPPQGAPVRSEQEAEPDDTGTERSHRVQDQQGPGQQLEVGEG